jgi:hypothetical protein
VRALPIHARIRCAGRQLDVDGKPTGKPCGKAAHDGCMLCDPWHPDAAEREALREGHAVRILAIARAEGWRVGPARADGTHDAMCPRCARPDPELVRLCGELAKPVVGGGPVQDDLFTLMLEGGVR